MTSQQTQQKELKCIEDGSVLQPARISGEPAMRCSECGRAWLSAEAFHNMEESAFDPDMVKGQMRYGEHPVEHVCPHCGQQMTRFRYRGYNLELEACPEDAGFWLDKGEERHVQDVMKRRTRNLRRSAGAQRDWNRATRGENQSFFGKLRDLFRR